MYSHNIVQLCNPDCVGCFFQLAHKQITAVWTSNPFYLHGDSTRPTGSSLISPVRLSQLQASCREGSQLQIGISEAGYRSVTAQASSGTLLPPCAEVWASILEDANERKWPRASCVSSAQMTPGEVADLPCRIQFKSLTRCSMTK